MVRRRGAGEPIYLAWRQFLRGRGPSVLVIDATGLDACALGAGAVLDNAPWLLAEGLLIAAGLRESLKVELRLPEELTGHEAAFLNTADAIRGLAQVAIPRRQIEVVRHSRPGCWGERQAGDGARLSHAPETWCRIALLFAGEAGLPKTGCRCVAADPPAWHEATRPGRARTIRQPAQPDRRLGWRRRGPTARTPVLVFDDGLGGLPPLSAADLPCEPSSSRRAGIIPAPSSHGDC